MLGSCTTTYKGPISDHFDGKHFYNPELKVTKGFADVIKWKMNSDKKQWPEFVDDVKQIKPTPSNKNEIKTTFINHATVLIQNSELNILTDPIWSDRASPVNFMGPKRARIPGVKIEDLPRIDLILISHNHFDHLDLKTLKILYQKFQPMVYVPLGNKQLLEGEGIIAEEMDWGDVKQFKNAKITFEPALHWSARGMFDRFKTLWGSFVIELHQKKIYFAGDTGYGSHFKTLREKYKNFELSFLPIGAYEPRWFMKDFHLNPKDAVQAHLDLNSQKSIGIHFGTFQLSDEAIDDPNKDLSRELKLKNMEQNTFVSPNNGDIFILN